MLPVFLIIITILAAVWVFSVIALTIGLEKALASRTKSEDKPSVSILIAARNEEESITACLDAIFGQDYPSDKFEVVVIDDNSADKTRALAEDFIKRIRNFKVISAGSAPAEITPKKNAILTGINNSTKEIIVTTDADCRPGSGWLSGIVQQFTPKVNAVVGYSPIEGKGIAGAVSRFDAFVNAVVSAGSIGLGKPSTATGRNFAYRRSAWKSVAGFGETAAGASGDDDLLLQRIAADGGTVIFASDPATYVPAQGSESLSRWLRMKRRHFSAGKRYQSGFIVVSALLYLFNLCLALAVTSLVINRYEIMQWVWLLWMLKALTDFTALKTGARLLKQRGWVLPWFAGELLSPFLITLIIPVSLFGKVRWKGRDLQS